MLVYTVRQSLLVFDVLGERCADVSRVNSSMEGLNSAPFVHPASFQLFLFVLFVSCCRMSTVNVGF